MVKEQELLNQYRNLNNNNMVIVSKVTGRDVTKEMNALMDGIITRDEFELITFTLK